MPAVIVQTPAVNAYATIEILNYADLAGASITIAGHHLAESSQWTAATDNVTTAASLKSAIDAVAGTAFTTSILGAVITCTSTTAGSAGNDIIGLTTDASPADMGLVTPGVSNTFGGGIDASIAGSIGSGRVRITTLAVTADSSGGSIQLFDGTDTTGTEYDFITGTASRTTLRTYKKGLVLANAYFSGDSHVTKIVAQFTAF